MGASPAAAQQPPPTPVVKLTVNGSGVRAHALGGEAWRAAGTIAPYVAGEPIDVRVSRRGKLITSRRVVPDAAGRFRVRLRKRRPGSYRVAAMHAATPASAYARSRRLRVLVHRARAGAGARGFVVRTLQTRLRALGYVIGRRGAYDARTARAVLAFRKNTGMARTTYASGEVFSRLRRGRGRFPVRFKGHGRHVEADLSKQVLALIGRGGKVERIYPTSSGTSATPTIVGNFRVYRRTPGTNALGMIHSSYFRGGYAIHGYHSVPTFPASHGCLRVPAAEAWSIYQWINYGTRVDVYP